MRMLRKVLSLMLALVMCLSLNVFALSGNDILHSGTQGVIIAKDAGVKAVLSKNADTLTVDVELVGEMNLITCIQTGFKFDATKLTYVGMELDEDFAALIANWTNGCSDSFASMGYVVGGYTANGKDYAINVAENTSIGFMTFTFTIANNVDINSTNYEDIINFNWDFFAQSWLTIDLTELNIDSTNHANIDVFSFDASALDSYNLSVNDPANGIAGISAPTVKGGEKVTVTATPAVGYYISSVMANEENITSSFNAYRGGKAEYIPSADTAFTVTFAKIESVSSEAESAGMTGVDAFTLPEVFRGKATDSATEYVSVAFGQIAPATGKTVAGYGIYLTYSDGRNVTTMAQGIGPKFPAEKKSADNKFGIIFEQLRPDSYNAQTYIEYTDGTIVKGIKVPFTVAE